MLLLQQMCTQFCNATGINFGYSIAFSVGLYAYSDIHNT